MAHTSVLLNEIIDILKPKSGKFFIDGTANGGGHTRALLAEMPKLSKFLALDWDKSAITKLEKDIKDSRVTFIHGNYAHLSQILDEADLPLADGLLLDIGFSSNQIEDSGRGFSFLKDEPLYMTYSDDEESVASILSRLTAKELADIIFTYGGERQSRRIAKAIKDQLKKEHITSSLQLAEIIRSALPTNYERGRIDPATRTFQALRIYANQELANLEELLNSLPKIIKPKGRVAIISFHSLEDKIVKEHFRQFAKDKQAELLTKKPIVPTEAEINNNPRSRSAKLRALQLN